MLTPFQRKQQKNLFFFLLRLAEQSVMTHEKEGPRTEFAMLATSIWNLSFVDRGSWE